MTLIYLNQDGISIMPEPNNFFFFGIGKSDVYEVFYI